MSDNDKLDDPTQAEADDGTTKDVVSEDVQITSHEADDVRGGSMKLYVGNLA